MPLFIGIDPGVSGGIAVISFDLVTAKVEVRAERMPSTERDLCVSLQCLVAHPCNPRAVLERVWSSPQMGVASAFTFGRSYGSILMALTACGIPYDEVVPQKWQASMGVRSSGTKGAKQGTKDKNIAKRRAQQLFPHIKVTHAIADALLIAEYCRRLHTGALDGPRTRR